VALGWAALAGALVGGAIQWVLLPRFVLETVPPGVRYAALPLLLSGAALVWAALAALGAFGADGIARLLRRKTARPRGLLFLGASALALPYAIGLSTFTYSGPRVRELWYRPSLVVATTLILAACFGAWAVSAAWTPRRRRTRLLFAVGCLLCGIALVVVNAVVLPNEYEPIHRFVSGAIILLLVSAADHGLRLQRRRRQLGRAGWLSAAAPWSVAVLAAATSVWLGATRETVGWVLWGEAAVTRYIPVRPDLGDDPDNENRFVLKPVVDSPRIRARRAERARKKPPHIVLFFIDNVQADHVGAYGYDKHPTTPNIDALAKRGALFRRAYSNYPQTRNFASQTITGRSIPTRFNRHNPPAVFIEESLTRLLKERGYTSFVHAFFDVTFQKAFDPQRYAIDTFVRPPSRKELRKVTAWPRIPVEGILKKLERHLARPGVAEKPALIWIHLLHPHWSGDEFVGSPRFPFGDGLVDRYDSAIAASDAWIPVLREMIRNKLHDPDNTVWIVGSDHGAGVSRQQEHVGKTLFEDQVHVPLVIAGPGIKPGTYDFAVDSALDVPATVLDLAGLEPPTRWDGISLVPLMQGDYKPVERALVLAYESRWKAAIVGRKKLIEYRGAASLYDLAADRLERVNLADRYPDLVDDLRSFARDTVARRRAAYRATAAE